VQAEPDPSLDVFAGARLLWLQPTLTYNFNVDVGPFVGPARVGSRSVTEKDWDAIVGLKGRVGFGANREWFIPTTSTSGRATRISRGRVPWASVTRCPGAT
jgi:hypothetical protein